MPFYKKPIYLIYYDKRSFVSIMAKSQPDAIDCFFVRFPNSLINRIELSGQEHFDYEW